MPSVVICRPLACWRQSDCVIASQTFSCEACLCLFVNTDADRLSQVSDGSGFGTGGTSTAALVQTGSSDSSCYSNTQASPPFTFSITTSNGGNGLVQCSPIRLWWDPTQTQG